MLDVGFSEILLTSAIALIVLGPERLPKVARQVGNWMGRARAMARQLSEQLEREVSAEELLKTQKKSDPSAADSPAGAANLASGGASFDSFSPSIPSAADVPPDVSPAPPSAPEPVYGLPADATTPAAMHASDPQVADSKPPHD